MKTARWNEVKEEPVERALYKGKIHPVTGTTIRWLSKEGSDEEGNPTYGLRYFTIQPGGEIPIHNHEYAQTMYILSGKFECYAYDFLTDEIMESKVCDAGMSVFAPSYEPHGMKNIGEEPGTFLCCIGTPECC